MPRKTLFMPHSLSDGHENVADGALANGHAERKNGSAEEKQAGSGMLSNHKGKLAVGAAAMLGLAVYYKWREHLLAKEDPEEYRRLRRIKSMVETDESRS